MIYSYDPEVLINIKDNAVRKRVPAIEERVKRLYKFYKKLKKHQQDVIELSTKYYNKTYKPIIFNKDNLVILLIKNLKQR